MGNDCHRCGKPVRDNHAICRVCRSSHVGGNDNDPPGPGVAPSVTDGPAVGFDGSLVTEASV